MIRLFWSIVLVAISCALPVLAADKLSFIQPLTCSFHYRQYLDSNKAKTDTLKNALAWNFFDLIGPKGPKPHFLSAGDTGPIVVHPYESNDGVAIWLQHGNKVNLFSIWPDGTAFWSKHNNIHGQKSSQQYRGVCTNIRRTD